MTQTLSISRNEDSMSQNTIQFAIISASAVSDEFENTQYASTANYALNRRICNDLRLSANDSLSGQIRAAQLVKTFELEPSQVNSSTIDNRNSYENQFYINRLSEKRQSDPQIRYAFYNKGFEMATTTKHRKHSISHYEVRRMAMPDIDECDAYETAQNEDEWTMLQQNTHSYTGSSGRDITLLPKLKLRISDEMGARIQHSFDETSSPDDNSIADDTLNNVKMLSPNNGTVSAKSSHIRSVNGVQICMKCGHELKTHKRNSNKFV